MSSQPPAANRQPPAASRQPPTAGREPADVRAYDEVYRHILAMSDALSDGIVKQFPDKFGA